MKKQGIYYMGRVIMMGILTKEDIVKSMQNPTTLMWGNNAWTFIEASVKYNNGNIVYGYGKLCKFAPQTELSVIDLLKKAVRKQPEDNLIIASSPFVYIPEHSGIAFLRVSNQIEANTFTKRFCSIIDETNKKFFVKCHIDPIADLRTFAIKLSNLDGIYGISAKVSPPNPLFGPLWGSLKDYLKSRKTESMKIDENSSKNEPLKTDLVKYVKLVADEIPVHHKLPEPMPIGDAAILMAADGYGTGYVRGRVGSEYVVIRTSETIKNFSFEKDPDPESFYSEAKEIFDKIKNERHMEHQ